MSAHVNWTPVAFRDEPAQVPMAPGGLTVGRSFRTLGVGPTYSRMGGGQIVDVTPALLHELARVFTERAAKDPVIFDWNHASFQAPHDAKKSASLGIVLSAWVEDEGDGRGLGLYVVPAYNARGLAVLADNEGSLWSSPEFVEGPVAARDTGEPAGAGQVFAIALTNRPAQTVDRIDAVRLSETDSQPKPAGAGKETAVETTESAALMDGEEHEGPTLEEALARIAELEEQLAATAASETAQAEAVQVAASEAGTLRSQVTALSEQVQALSEAKELADIDARLFADGIAPASRDNARKLLSAGMEEVYASLFGEGSAHRVPMGEVGHGETPAPTQTHTPQSVRALLAERAATNGTNYMAEKRTMRHSAEDGEQSLYALGFGEG